MRAVGTLPAELTSVSGLAASHRHDEGTSRVYIADIGDNLAIRPSVQLYVFDEPDPTDTAVTPRVVQMTYLVVHNGTVWVIDKNPDGPATVWRLDADPDTADQGALRPVSTLDLPGEQVTGADLPEGAGLLSVSEDEGGDPVTLHLIEPAR